MTERPQFVRGLIDLFGEDTVAEGCYRGNPTWFLFWPYPEHEKYDELDDGAYSPEFYDDGSPIWDERPCPQCGLCSGGTSRPDPCLGFIDDAGGACCGHGNIRDAYVAGVDIPGGKPHPRKPDDASLWLHGQDALDFFAKMGVGPSALDDV